MNFGLQIPPPAFLAALIYSAETLAERKTGQIIPVSLPRCSGNVSILRCQASAFPKCLFVLGTLHLHLRILASNVSGDSGTSGPRSLIFSPAARARHGWTSDAPELPGNQTKRH